MNKFNKLYNLIMEDLRDDLKEGQEYEVEKGKITSSKKDPDVNDPTTREKLVRQWAKKYKWTTTDIEEQIKNFLDRKKDKQFKDKKELYYSLNWWIGPGDEDQDDDIDVNYSTVFDTLEEIVKSADPKALQRLHKRFENYEGSNDRQACCDIMEGDGWGVWTGLMDPANWRKMGFKLTPTQKKILTTYNNDVNNGAFYDFDDNEVEMTKDFMIAAGGQDIVDSFEE